MRAPRAFSVVELLTALVLLAVGLAAFTRAAAAVAWLERDARLRRVVAEMALARIDTVSGYSCGASVEGESSRQGVRERWHVAPDAGHAQLVDSLSVLVRPSLSRTLVTALACRP